MSTMLSYHQTGIIIPSLENIIRKKKRLDYARFSFGILRDGYNEGFGSIFCYEVTPRMTAAYHFLGSESESRESPKKKNFFWYWNPGLVDPTTWEDLLKLNEFFLCMTNWFHWWNDFWKWWNPKLAIRYEIQSQSHKIAGRPGFRGYLIVK